MLLHIVWDILTPVFLVVAVGSVGTRWLRMDTGTLSTAAFHVFTPCLVFASLWHTQLDVVAVRHIIMLHIGMTLCLAVFGWLSTWTWARNSALRNAVILTTIIQNAGNYGLPISRFAFGDGAMEMAVVYYVCMQVSANTLGVLLTSAGATTPCQVLRNLASAPLLYATVLALLGRTWAITLPAPILRGVELCGAAAIPVLLLMLGMQLAQCQVGKDIGPTSLAVGLRLIVAPLLAMVLTNALGMEGLIRTVGIAQWSAPTAVTTLVLACQYDCQPRYVAGVILATTLLSVVTVPVLLMWLM